MSPWSIEGIKPAQGWSLHWFPEDDGDGFVTDRYEAHRGNRRVCLPVSRFQFTPTQERFAALVEMNFARPARGNWTDDELDALIAARIAA